MSDWARRRALRRYLITNERRTLRAYSDSSDDESIQHLDIKVLAIDESDRTVDSEQPSTPGNEIPASTVLSDEESETPEVTEEESPAPT